MVSSQGQGGDFTRGNGTGGECLVQAVYVGFKAYGDFLRFLLRNRISLRFLLVF